MPDDAAVRVDRLNGRLVLVPEWDPQRGQFGYTRKLRFVFFDRGGHVAMAKRYRAYARKIGLFSTLAEKRQSNPDVDLLMGAVNVWCWDRNAVPLVRELQAAGIDRIFCSNQQSPENLRALNELGVLTSRYDIYQDVMAPTNLSRVRWIHPDWTTNAWPKDLILDRRGDWIKGWGVESRDGTLIPCGVICDRRAPDSARARVPLDLSTRPYRCRFIDTTTAAPWQECFHPDHPMTRTESRKWKMELLRYISEDQRLVTGCETGHDAAVPFLHYFEGMLLRQWRDGHRELRSCSLSSHGRRPGEPHGVPGDGGLAAFRPPGKFMINRALRPAHLPANAAPRPASAAVRMPSAIMRATDLVVAVVGNRAARQADATRVDGLVDRPCACPAR